MGHITDEAGQRLWREGPWVGLPCEGRRREYNRDSGNDGHGISQDSVVVGERRIEAL